MPRRGEQRPARREFDDAAEVHDADAVRDVVDDRKVVRDEEVREAHLALQVLHQVQHLGLHGDVERRRRFVADEDSGLVASARAIDSRCRWPPENWWRVT